MQIRLSEYQSDILLQHKPGLDIERLLSLIQQPDRSIRVVFKDRIFGWRLAVVPERDPGRKPTILFSADAERLQDEITDLLASSLEPDEKETRFWDLIGQLHSLPLPKEFESSGKA